MPPRPGAHQPARSGSRLASSASPRRAAASTSGQGGAVPSGRRTWGARQPHSWRRTKPSPCMAPTPASPVVVERLFAASGGWACRCCLTRVFVRCPQTLEDHVLHRKGETAPPAGLQEGILHGRQVYSGSHRPSDPRRVTGGKVNPSLLRLGIHQREVLAAKGNDGVRRAWRQGIHSWKKVQLEARTLAALDTAA